MDPAKYIMDSRVKTKACTDAGEHRQEHHGQRRQEHAGQEQEDGQDQVFTHDIAEETQSQGEHPGEVADDLNEEEQRRQGRDGSQKMLDILGPVVLDPQVMGDRRRCTRPVARVILILDVGDRNPGSSPIRLQNMMNRKKVPMNGKKARPSSPVTSTMNSSRPPRISSKTFWAPWAPERCCGWPASPTPPAGP